MNIGIIGAGQIGSTLIKHFTNAGHDVKMANASGIENLKALEGETGAKAVSLSEIVHEIEVLIIAIPLCEIPRLAQALENIISDDTTVIDTTNYYPIRDGRIEEIELGLPESVWVSTHLSRPVVKVYNSILAGSLLQSGRSKDTKGRIALPLSGDNDKSKDVAASLVNDCGFDALDIGNLSNSWRQQPGSPIYCTDLILSELKHNIYKAHRDSLSDRRELALQFILKQDPTRWLDWWKECVSNNRIVYQTELNT